MSRCLYILCAVFFFMTLGAAFAGNAPATLAPKLAANPEIDLKAVTLAAEMVTLLDGSADITRIFDTTSKNVYSLILRDNPKQNKIPEKLVKDAMHSAILPHMDEIGSNTAKLYAQNYSVEEMQQIVDFYKKPVGQKMLKTMPDIMVKTISINMPVVKAAMQDGMASVVLTLKKKGMNVPRELGY